MIRVCTGWSPAGREEYGQRFLRSFNRHWPREVRLQVYVEDVDRSIAPMCERDLWAIPGAREFADRHRDNPAMNGRQANARWKDREVREGYSFKFDAYKFFKQILIPQAAAEGLRDGDILVWLDGDTETLHPVPNDFVAQLLGDAEVCYLNRHRQHSEIGFWAVRINDRTRDFLGAMADLYTSDRFLALPEWHSAYIWDEARRHAGLCERHLVRPGQRGHVWPSTALARYLRHDKGKRKGRGHG